jgi:hypothetical protein
MSDTVLLTASCCHMLTTLLTCVAQVPPLLASEFEEIWRSNRHRPLAVRNHLIASICPQIYGLFAVKLAILLTLIGGITENVSMRCHDTLGHHICAICFTLARIRTHTIKGARCAYSLTATHDSTACTAAITFMLLCSAIRAWHTAAHCS